MNQELIANRDIIIVGQQPWDTDIGSNCKNIAIEFSKYNRVLYVNSPLDTISRIKYPQDPKIIRRRKAIADKKNELIRIQENLWNLYPDCEVRSVNWIGPEYLFNLVNKNNNKKFASSIKKAIEDLGFKNYILFNDNELIKTFYLKDFLSPSISIYYSRDYILATDYWKKHGERLEPLVISKADLCLANSIYLKEYCEKNNPQSFFVGQGCDVGIFSTRIAEKQKPVDLSNIPLPIIGYAGFLSGTRLDVLLLEDLAANNPVWNFVFVGSEDEIFSSSNLHNLSNVTFTGPKPPEEIPGYINSFDICINPQIVNQLTIGNYPRKIDEYLAMGKPVVATATKAMEMFEEYVYLCEKKEGYTEMIRKAIKEDNKVLAKKRIDFALTHSWENSVKQIYKAINTVIS